MVTNSNSKPDFSNPSSEKNPEQSVRVLVVDDDPVHRNLLRIALENKGYECLEAENGREGIEALENHQIDMVLSDQQMPVMTGIELIHELHERQKDLAPPVILMSGDHQSHLQHQARKVGASAFFGKPYHMETLLHTVSLVMTNRFAPIFSH